MGELEKDLVSIFTWLNTTCCFSHHKERQKLVVDKFTLINTDSIQNIELYMKALRLIIEDEIILAVLIEKAKKEGQIISTSFYNLSQLVFNSRNRETYKIIRESLNALQTSVIKLQKGPEVVSFSFIDTLGWGDERNEKGSIVIRLSSEIYDFYIKRNPYTISIDLNNYRSLTGGRIQKLLFLYLKSSSFTFPTPLIKIQEILQLKNLKLSNFKRSFTDGLTAALKKEGVNIEIKGDNIIYKRSRAKVVQPAALELSQKIQEPDLSLSPDEITTLAKIGINQTLILSHSKLYSSDAAVKAAKKLLIIKKNIEIRNPAGFYQKMLEKGTYLDIDELSKKEQSLDNKAMLGLIKRPVNLTPDEEANRKKQFQEYISQYVKEIEGGIDAGI